MPTSKWGLDYFGGNDPVSRANFNAKLDEIDTKGVAQSDFDAHRNAATLAHPDASVTDAKIGSRTVSDVTTPASDTSVLGTLLSNLATMIRLITGETSWRTSPKINLDTVYGKFLNSPGHSHNGTLGNGPQIHYNTLTNTPASLVRKETKDEFFYEADASDTTILSTTYTPNLDRIFRVRAVGSILQSLGSNPTFGIWWRVAGSNIARVVSLSLPNNSARRAFEITLEITKRNTNSQYFIATIKIMNPANIDSGIGSTPEHQYTITGELSLTDGSSHAVELHTQWSGSTSTLTEVEMYGATIEGAVS